MLPTIEAVMLATSAAETRSAAQDRLFRLTDEASGRRFAVASCRLSDGLIVQLRRLSEGCLDSRLIVV